MFRLTIPPSHLQHAFQVEIASHHQAGLADNPHGVVLRIIDVGSEGQWATVRSLGSDVGHLAAFGFIIKQDHGTGAGAVVLRVDSNSTSCELPLGSIST